MFGDGYIRIQSCQPGFGLNSCEYSGVSQRKPELRTSDELVKDEENSPRLRTTRTRRIANSKPLPGAVSSVAVVAGRFNGNEAASSANVESGQLAPGDQFPKCAQSYLEVNLHSRRPSPTKLQVNLSSLNLR